MQKTIILFLLLSLLTCRHKKFSKIWDFPQRGKSSLSFFTYGVEPDKTLSLQESSSPKWGPVLRTVEGKICLTSHDDFFRSKEYGPILNLCIENHSENEILISSALKTLNELDETKLRPDGFLRNEGNLAHLYFLSLTEIVNEISKAKVRKLFIGDNRLFNALEKRMDFSFENHFSIKGKSPNLFETNFSLPYFSLYEIDGEYKIVFPPLDFWTPRSQYHYMVIEFTNIPDLISKFQIGFDTIAITNEHWKEKCTPNPLEITEVMGYSSGITKRFLEWAGSIENSTCLNNVNLTISETTKTIELDSNFLFPGAVKLFLEEDSPLQGIEVKDFNWKDIKNNSVIEMVNFSHVDKWNLPEIIKFNWNEEEFSLKRLVTSCGWNSLIFENSKFCGDPGINFKQDEYIFPPDTTSSSSTTNICNADNFILSELNASGLQLEDKIDQTGKFIELQFIGNNPCKLTDLYLVIDTNKIPLFGTGLVLTPNSYLVISDGRHFTDLLNLVRRNIDFLQWESKIHLENSNSTKPFWNGIGANRFFLPRSMDGNLYSMIFLSEEFVHHPIQKSKYLQSIYQSNHRMSPGEANIELVNNPEAEISEILWAGGYKNSISIPDEKFVELKTKGEGSLELEIKTDSTLNKYYIPITKADIYTVISKTNLQCFTGVRSILADTLHLTNFPTEINVKSKDRILSQLKYDPNTGHGNNNSTLKLRASLVNTGIKQTLQTSKQTTNSSILQECKDQTFASPERPNEFEPFLVDEVFTYAGNGLFLLGASLQEQSLPFRVKIYSHLPQAESTQLLERGTTEISFKPISSQINNSGLSYQKLENYSDLKIYNRDGIFLEGIMANPSSSQNEWILLCNRGSETKDLSNYEIDDLAATDQIDSYFTRKKISLPTGVKPAFFQGNSTLLSPGQCGYLVDPDSSGLNLKQIGISPTLIFTVRSTATIGNGISSGEYLDLYKRIGNERIHVHSFGNKFSHAPFMIHVNTDDIILLKPNKRGESKYDYEIVRW